MLETFQAHRFLATFRNKTDKNDAHGLAQLVRMGGEDFLRVVKVRSIGAQETRTMLSVRYHLVTQKVALEIISQASSNLTESLCDAAMSIKIHSAIGSLSL